MQEAPQLIPATPANEDVIDNEDDDEDLDPARMLHSCPEGRLDSRPAGSHHCQSTPAVLANDDDDDGRDPARMLCRCAEGRLDSDLQAALGQASARAGEAGGGAGSFQPADKKAAKRAQAQTWDLQRGVSAAARAALTGQ